VRKSQPKGISLLGRKPKEDSLRLEEKSEMHRKEKEVEEGQSRTT
jgi:wobble nucleotide-excising tRNase